MLRILTAVACFGLGGCAALIAPVTDSAYTWFHSGREPMPMEVIKVNQSVLQELECNTNGFVQASAWLFPEVKRCIVYTALDKLPEETRIHEQKHCDGFDHQLFFPKEVQTVCKKPAELGL